MPATDAVPAHLCFGAFELDLATGELRKAGVLIHLPPQPFRILALLAGRSGQLITREEIQQQIWGNETFVDFEHGLNFAIKRIREALSDDAEAPRYIETLPRRGYRFIALVEALTPGSSPGGRGELGKGMRSPGPNGQREPERVSQPSPPERGWPREAGTGEGVGAPVSPPAMVGAGLALPSRAQSVGPVREPPLLKRWTVIEALAGTILLAIAALLIAFNVAGLRERLLTAAGAGFKPAPGQVADLPLQIHSIAVLPLENLSRDPEQEYFADGMTDELISSLAKISSLRVISRTSVMRYKGTKKPLPEIARELKVDGIVEGSVLRSGNRLRIMANLLHGPTDRHLWTDSYESDLGDVLILQGEVARSIANEVRIKVTPEEQARLTATRAVDPEVYRLYLQGNYHLARESSSARIDKSLRLFQQVLEKDPQNALGWAGLAQSYTRDAIYIQTSPKDAFEKARTAAQKALEIDNSLAEAHSALGYIHLRWDWD